ncbi:MAG: four helix bundle protein [Bacteroidota bacterium]
METVKRFEDLIVWQKSRILAKEIFLLSWVHQIKKDYGLRQ